MDAAPDLKAEEESAEPIQPARTPWHRILARLFELLLTPLGVTVQTELPIMSEPPKVDILLVRRSGNRWTEQQLRLLCDGLRQALAATLIIEFKFSESLTVEALRQALGYDYFYRMAQRVSESEAATFVMVARTPRARVLAELGCAASETPGVYRTRQPVLERVQVIVLNQLQPAAHNFFVQQFASQRRVRKVAFEGLGEVGETELSESVLELLFGLRGKFEVEEGEMGKAKEQRREEVITPEALMKMGREIRQMVFATMKPEERQMVLASLAPEERLAGLAPEERLAGLAPEELAQLMEEIEKRRPRSHN